MPKSPASGWFVVLAAVDPRCRSREQQECQLRRDAGFASQREKRSDFRAPPAALTGAGANLAQGALSAAAKPAKQARTCWLHAPGRDKDLQATRR
jgi:hypothetical protein